MTHILGRVFLAAVLGCGVTILLPSLRGDRRAAGAARGERACQAYATATLTTKKIKDIPIGQAVRVGSSKFVKITGNSLMMSEQAGCQDPVLTTTGASKSFSYTGGQQTFTAYSFCQYKLEVWGAAGGGPTGYRGGYGGYATGVYNSFERQTLYIYVGGQGLGTNVSQTALAGGYNGGGNITPAGTNHVYGSGGGATHMAKVSGLLSSLSAHATNGNILIIAGGGGGGRDQANRWGAGRCGIGGSGGGYIGGRLTSSFGSDSSMSEHDDRAGTQTAGYLFGQGENANSNGSGGGGWYGGCNGNDRDYSSCQRAGNYYGSGSGGSGYIGSSNLISTGSVTKHMTCYSCTTSTADATRTQSNTCVNATATADCSKTGNGYARITRLN